jgi:hypothetical protein
MQVRFVMDIWELGRNRDRPDQADPDKNLLRQLAWAGLLLAGKGKQGPGEGEP